MEDKTKTQRHAKIQIKTNRRNDENEYKHDYHMFDSFDNDTERAPATTQKWNSKTYNVGWNRIESYRIESHTSNCCRFYAVIIPHQILLFDKRHNIYCRLLSLYEMHLTTSKVCVRACARSHSRRAQWTLNTEHWTLNERANKVNWRMCVLVARMRDMSNNVRSGLAICNFLWLIMTKIN